MGSKTLCRAARLLVQWQGGRTMTEAAAALKLDQTQYWRFVNGKLKPGRLVAARIHRLTGGVVPFDAWDEDALPPLSVPVAG